MRAVLQESRRTAILPEEPPRDKMQILQFKMSQHGVSAVGTQFHPVRTGPNMGSPTPHFYSRDSGRSSFAGVVEDKDGHPEKDAEQVVRELAFPLASKPQMAKQTMQGVLRTMVQYSGELKQPSCP